MRKMVLAALIAIGVSGDVRADGLDGTTWDIDRNVLQLQKADELRFDDGKFNSLVGTKQGYEAGVYEVQAEENGRIIWTAIQLNGLGEKKEWQGTVIGDAMAGYVLLTESNGRTDKREWTARKSAQLRGGR